MDLDLWDHFGRKKNPSYIRGNMVRLNQRLLFSVESAHCSRILFSVQNYLRVIVVSLVVKSNSSSPGGEE